MEHIEEEHVTIMYFLFKWLHYVTKQINVLVGISKSLMQFELICIIKMISFSLQNVFKCIVGSTFYFMLVRIQISVSVCE